MKNKFILIILGMFLISLVNANLIITENPKDITTNLNENKSYSISVFNNNSFNIYNLEFENLEDYGFTFPSNITINSNQTKTIQLYVKTTSSYHGSLTSNVKFYYLVDLPEEITNYNIYVGNSGFDLTYVDVRQQDTITFTNDDTISHNIYIENYGTVTVSPNSTQTMTLNTIGDFDFYDTNYKDFSFFNGKIQVISRTESQKVNNPNYDITWNINLESNLNPTTLSINNSQTEFNVTNKKSKNGQFTIKNTGSQTAELVKVTSNKDWLYFDKEEFNLDAEDTYWLGYKIMPYFFNSNETNKTYEISIIFTGSNIGQYNETISVFIPYQEITEDFNNDYEYLVYMDTVFCVKRPCSAFCSPELPECVNAINGTGNRTGICSLNLTEESWYETMRKLSEMQENNNRLINIINELNEKYGDLNKSSSELSNDVKSSNKNTSSTQTILLIILFSSVIIAVVVYWIKNLNKKTALKGRGIMPTEWRK